MRELSPKTSALSRGMCLCLFTKARSRKEHVRSAGLPYILPRERELTLLCLELRVVKLICLLDRIVKLLIELGWIL